MRGEFSHLAGSVETILKRRFDYFTLGLLAAFVVLVGRNVQVAIKTYEFVGGAGYRDDWQNVEQGEARLENATDASTVTLWCGWIAGGIGTPLLGLVIAARMPTSQLICPVDFWRPLRISPTPSTSSALAVTTLRSVTPSGAARPWRPDASFCSVSSKRALSSVLFGVEAFFELGDLRTDVDGSLIRLRGLTREPLETIGTKKPAQWPVFLVFRVC